MTAGREVELKYILQSAHHWRRLGGLLAALAPPDVIVQRNLYLDSADLALRRAAVMVRIRCEEHRVVVACKSGARLVDGLMTVGESQAVLAPAEAAHWRADRPAAIALAELPVATAVRDALGAPHLDLRLVVVARLDNRRQRFALTRLTADGPPLMADGSAVQFELDEARLDPLTVRYELEVEHPEAAKLGPRIGDWLNAARIRWRSATDSKYGWVLRNSGAVVVD